jgi:hypothetical protein
MKARKPAAVPGRRPLMRAACLTALVCVAALMLWRRRAAGPASGVQVMSLRVLAVANAHRHRVVNQHRQ